MPTGYTADVAKEDFTFEDFIWQCARAFGALIHMRDDSMKTEITFPQETSYYKESVQTHIERLATLEDMSLAEAAKEIDKEYASSQKYAKEALVEKKKECQRYQAMLAKVEAWAPPTDEHKGLKKFMLEQLTSTIEHDCDEDYYQRQLNQEKETPSAWLKSAIESEKDSLKYAKERAKKEKESNEKSVQWLKDLQKSVPLPKKVRR